MYITEYITTITETAISTYPALTAGHIFAIYVILGAISSNLFFNPNADKTDLEVIGAILSGFGPSTVILALSIHSPITGYWSHAIPYATISVISLFLYMKLMIIAANYRRDRRVADITPPYDLPSTTE